MSNSMQKPECRSQNAEVGEKDRGHKIQGGSRRNIVIIFLLAGLLLIAQSSLLVAQNPPAKSEEKAAAKGGDKTTQPEGRAAGTEEKRQGDLAEREETLRREEARLKALKTELDEKIEKYTKLLARMEATLKSIETAKDERYEHLIKAYEAMPNEEAAARLSALDEPAAMKIIVKMKSKKAGAVMAAMEPRKAAALTEGMMSMAKKFPAR